MKKRFSLEELASEGKVVHPFPEDLADLEVGEMYDLDGVITFIEYRPGDKRTKKGKDGTSWTQTMTDFYGYIPNTTDRHGEPIDFYLCGNKEIGGFHRDAAVETVDQVFYTPEDEAINGQFDEHKVMLGYASRDVARDAYVACFADEKGDERFGAITTLPKDLFILWLDTSDTTQPISCQDLIGADSEGFVQPFADPSNDDLNVNPSQDQTVDPKTGKITQTQGKSESKPVIRNGGVVVPLPVVGDGPYISTGVTEDGKGRRYDIYMIGYVCCWDWGVLAEDLCRMLDAAAETDEFVFHIASYGGSLDIACRICSAMQHTKAKTRTVAAGGLCSAATFLWAEGKEHTIKPGAYFMEHMSSHGEGGNSQDIAFNAKALVSFVTHVVLKRMRDLKMFTDEEITAMVDKRQDVYVCGYDVAERMGLEVDCGK